MNTFFPGKGRADLRKRAKEICQGCIVKDDCEDYKLTTDSQYGIWAGKTPKDFERDAQ